MQPLAIARQTAGSLLFVRTSVNLGRAIHGVNEFLSYRPRRLSPADEVLGVIECDDVDVHLSFAGREDGVRPSGELTLRESVGLGGIWNLCSFDMMILRHRATAEHRRKHLLESLFHGKQAGGAGAWFIEQRERVRVLPVFSEGEGLHEVERLVDDLAARYPQLSIGPTCFRHDPTQRELVPLVWRTVTSEYARDACEDAPSPPSAGATATSQRGTEAADETF
jgi:hypothetical protein